MQVNGLNPEINMGGHEMQHIRVAILDLYNNEPNEGMRCVQQILNDFPLFPNQTLSFKIYDVRFRHAIPEMDYDIYISTGGPGSPLEEPGAKWEKKYFNWIEQLLQHNRQNASSKKHAFFICHSFQLLCRHLDVGDVTKRHSTAFGIFPIHLTESGKNEFLFKGLKDPFYAVDSRDWQVVQPNHQKLAKLGATILAIEKERKHVNFERAVMTIRFSDEIVGSQFHPEADALGMLHYMMRSDKRMHIIKHHGKEKYDEMLLHLNDPDKLLFTQNIILPAFLNNAINNSSDSVDQNALALKKLSA